MKRFIYIFITLLWMISYATAQESLPCRGTATTVLNVRSGPGTSYARIGQLSRGQEVNVIQKSRNNWYRLSSVHKGICLLQIPKILSFAPKGKLSVCQIVFRFLLMEFLESILVNNHLGNRYLPRTGRALLGVQGTAYCLFHRISCIHIHLQNNQPSFFLAECFATI